MANYGDLFDFSGKRALITGAANGIGEAMARGFSRQGADLVLADRDEQGLQRVAEATGGHVQSYDQADLTSVEALVEAAGPLDILINNAGILLCEPLKELKWPDLRRVIDVNLVGVIALTRLVGDAMVSRGSGTIINISSQMAFNGARWRAVYASTKAAVAQFTKTAAVEWGEYGVRVNCIAPGKTITNINRHLLADPIEYEEGLKRTPLKRYGQPEDIANIGLFLASDASSFVTGHTIVADGGWILE